MARLVQLSTLRDRVITLCDLPATLDTTTSPTAVQILDLLQTSASLLSGIVREIPGAAFQFAESSTIPTVANVAMVSLPTSASDLLRLSWLRDSETEVLLQRAGIEGMSDRQPGWDSVTMPSYRVIGQTVELYPTPTAVYSLKAYYATGLYPSTISSYVLCMDGWDQWIAVHTATLVRARQQRLCPELDMMLMQLERSIRASFQRDIYGPAVARDLRGSSMADVNLLDPSKWGNQ